MPRLKFFRFLFCFCALAPLLPATGEANEFMDDPCLKFILEGATSAAPKKKILSSVEISARLGPIVEHGLLQKMVAHQLGLYGIQGKAEVHASIRQFKSRNEAEKVEFLKRIIERMDEYLPADTGIQNTNLIAKQSKELKMPLGQLIPLIQEWRMLRGTQPDQVERHLRWQIESATDDFIVRVQNELDRKRGPVASIKDKVGSLFVKKDLLPQPIPLHESAVSLLIQNKEIFESDELKTYLIHLTPKERDRFLMDQHFRLTPEQLAWVLEQEPQFKFSKAVRKELEWLRDFQKNLIYCYRNQDDDHAFEEYIFVEKSLPYYEQKLKVPK